MITVHHLETSRSQRVLSAYKEKMEARPAYQRALAKGGPVVMSV
jgi:hypothetical protein